MIQQQTVLSVLDNSGAKKVKCVKVLGGYKKKSAYLGDNIVVSVKELRNKFKSTSKVKKGEVHRAVILKTKSKIMNKDGSISFFSDNCVCLINKQLKPIGTRITGPISKNLKNKNFKLVSLSPGSV